MKIAIGSDHGGYKLKEKIKKYLRGKRVQLKDFGAFSEESVDYPDIGRAVAKAVARKRYKYGILVCGSGLGMSMVANKVKGIRAAVCHNIYTAEMARRHNDANVLSLGGRVLKGKLPLKMVDKFLKTRFEGGRHSRRVKKIGR
ncbi:ribose 5-phosphate isomerase B [Candidatus Margulisiibacteriota bacterium]